MTDPTGSITDSTGQGELYSGIQFGLAICLCIRGSFTRQTRCAFISGRITFYVDFQALFCHQSYRKVYVF